jgi:hypothetical protein
MKGWSIMTNTMMENVNMVKVDLSALRTLINKNIDIKSLEVIKHNYELMDTYEWHTFKFNRSLHGEFTKFLESNGYEYMLEREHQISGHDDTWEIVVKA